MRTFSTIAVLFVASHLCLAQNGYTYPRPPDGSITGPSTIAPGATPPLRPGASGGYPSPAGPSFPGTPGFPTTAPAYGGTGFTTGPGGFSTTPAAPGFPGRPGGSVPAAVFPPAPVVPVRPGTGAGFPSGPSYTPGSRPSFPTGGGQYPTDVGGGDYEGGDYSAIPGEPGVDYPIYSDIPKTSFDCIQQQWPGYYADVDTQCQVFHICALNRTYDFLCPNGTIFSQEHLVCVWWNQFDCSTAPSLYGNNAFIYDYSQTGQTVQTGGFPSATGGPVGIPSGTARPPTIAGYPGAGRPTGPAGVFPGAGRPTTSGGTYPGASGPQGPGTTYPTGTGLQGPPVTYPGVVGPPGSSVNYPGVQGPTGPSAGFPGSAAGPTGSTAGFPSRPGAIAPGFPSTSRPSFPPQADSPFSATPQTPNREYLPPRRA